MKKLKAPLSEAKRLELQKELWEVERDALLELADDAATQNLENMSDEELIEYYEMVHELDDDDDT